jgi:diadenosine tetraphosphate (Ap4A) HIT family hydrolase
MVGQADNPVSQPLVSRETTRMFELHQQLAADCAVLGSFPLCRLLLIRDANYPWFILVPARADIREIHELAEDDQAQWLKESGTLARAMMQVFEPDKLNVAALGNMVPQLHIHYIARYRTDAAWPGPVWGRVPAEPYTKDALAEVGRRLVEALPAESAFKPEPA